jgi:hypothetical protein
MTDTFSRLTKYKDRRMHGILVEESDWFLDLCLLVIVVCVATAPWMPLG